MGEGKNVTAVCAVNASGSYVPPMLIFPRKRMKPALKKGGPIGALYGCSDNGWINENLFFDWIQHFKDFVKCSTNDKVLILLDNHASHISLRIYTFCRENGIELITIPPHTSHRLQPLDLTFYGPLKNMFNRECDLYLRSHPFEKITHDDLAEIFNNAYVKVATMEKGISGFRSAGIWPLNPDKFNDEDFAPAQHDPAYDRPVENQPNLHHLDFDSSQPLRPQLIPSSSFEPQPGPSQPPLPQPGPSQPYEPQPNQPLHPQSNQGIKVSEIYPVPSAKDRQSTSKVKRNTKQHSQVLTATPMKKKLEMSDEKKKGKNTFSPRSEKRKKPLVKKKRTSTKKPKNKKTCNRKICFFESESEESQIEDSQLCDDNEMDTMLDADVCLVCGDSGKGSEMWYRCVLCGKWSHKDCSGWDTPVGYTCDMCID